MSVALAAVNPHEIENVARPRPANPDRLRELARCAGQLADIVENEWATLKPIEKDIFRKLEAEVSSLRKPSILLRIRFAILILRSELDSVVMYRNAVGRLIDAVTDAVEREHSQYATSLSEALQDHENSKTRPMSSEDFGEWLATQTDSAL